MGMAASQARLLTLTARLSDNELRSQTINNAKMRLATESSQASENYINALNNATLKFTNYDETGAALTQPLTYNSLMAYSSYNTQYGLVNSSGQILVSEAEAKMFKDANGDLNKYLKAHGLEYTTTYFKEAGGIENNDYPAPFNNVSSDTLQQWYEEYGSYENSVEVENYNKAYSNYNSTRNTLTHSLSKTLEEYFGASGSGENRTSGGYEYKNEQTAQWNLSQLKTAYSNATNKYSYNNTTTQKFVEGLNNTTSGAGKAMHDLLNSYTFSVGSLIVKETSNLTQNAAGGYTFTFEDYNIIMDADGRVTEIKTSNAGDLSSTLKYETSPGVYSTPTFNDEGESSWTVPAKADTKQPTLKEFLQSFEITENRVADDGTKTPIATIKASYPDTTINTEKNITITKKYSDSEAMKGEIQNLNEKLLTILKENTDYSKFGEAIIRGQISGISLSPAVIKYVEDCIDYKKAFIETIFKDTTTQYQFPITDDDGNITGYSTAKNIEEAIDDGTVKMNSLTNEEYVLWLAKNSKDASGNDLTEETSFMSENFKTVVKTFIIENTLIAKYGTPKYAWVDEMDTQNTGNADSKAQWYTNLYKRMEKGYKTLENGLASSQQWIEYALETGLVTMEQVDKSYNWQSLEYKTCTRITEVTDDEAVAKAEAEYNRAINDIKTKDNMYDVQLKNIDTEHTSLQTEYDSIKQVITKNIDRTFKFDQSA